MYARSTAAVGAGLHGRELYESVILGGRPEPCFPLRLVRVRWQAAASARVGGAQACASSEVAERERYRAGAAFAPVAGATGARPVVPVVAPLAPPGELTPPPDGAAAPLRVRPCPCGSLK